MLGVDAFQTLAAAHVDPESVKSVLPMLDQFDAAQEYVEPSAPTPVEPLNRSAEAIAVCDYVVARIGDAAEPALREQVARAGRAEPRSGIQPRSAPAWSRTAPAAERSRVIRSG
jgi:hypothetical protein